MFRTYVRRRRGPRVPASQISPVGSCEGAAAMPGPGAAACGCEGAASSSCEGATSTCRGEPPQNLTFKIKFPAANICSKFEKFCQIFSAHSTSCIGDRPHHPTNRNLKKFQNSFIIYIESERRKKTNSFPSPMKGLRFLRGIRKKIIWKVLKILL